MTTFSSKIVSKVHELRTLGALPRNAVNSLSDLSVTEREREAKAVALASRLFERRRMERDAEVTSSQISDLKRALRHEKQKLVEINERIEGFTTPEEFKKIVEKDFKKIKDRLPISGITVIEDSTLLILTHLLIKDNKRIGSFIITIDFLKQNHGDAIRMKNIYKTCDREYDHPCIKLGTLCQGTFEPELHKHFHEKNFFKLLETCLDFLVSDKVEDGWISSWDRFHANSRPVQDIQDEYNRITQPWNYSSNRDFRTLARESLQII